MRTSDADSRRTRTNTDEHKPNDHERPPARRSPLSLTRRTTLGVLALAGFLASSGVRARAQEDDDRIAELEREVEQLRRELAEIREEVADLSVTVDDEAIAEAVFAEPFDDFLPIFEDREVQAAIFESTFIAPQDDLVELLRAGARGETAAFQGALGQGLFVAPGVEFLDPIRTGEAREFLTALGEGLEELGIVSPEF